jgi:hypothetical protein
MGWYGLDSSGSGWVPVEGSCEHGNERSNLIKCRKIPEQLSDFSRRTQLHGVS